MGTHSNYHRDNNYLDGPPIGFTHARSTSSTKTLCGRIYTDGRKVFISATRDVEKVDCPDCLLTKGSRKHLGHRLDGTTLCGDFYLAGDRIVTFLKHVDCPYCLSKVAESSVSAEDVWTMLV